MSSTRQSLPVQASAPHEAGGEPVPLIEEVVVALQVDGVGKNPPHTSLGIQTAIDEAGKRGKIAVIGIDGTVPQLEQVRDGVQPAAVEQFPFLMGYQAVEACVAATAGKSVPKSVPTPVLVVTKDNAKEALDVYPAPPKSFNFEDPLRELVK